jgi:hypothetical protein
VRTERKEKEKRKEKRKQDSFMGEKKLCPGFSALTWQKKFSRKGS